MSDDNDPKPPKDDQEDPIADLKRGVGLLFRAAKTAATTAKDTVHADKVERAFKGSVDELHKALDRLQTDKLEGALKTSLQEIGRAFGNVAQTIERELSDKKDDKKP